jgi:hypothetical protein
MERKITFFEDQITTSPLAEDYAAFKVDVVGLYAHEPTTIQEVSDLEVLFPIFLLFGYFFFLNAFISPTGKIWKKN